MTHEDLELYVNAALGKKARHLVLLDLAGLSSVADYFIICSGASNRQVTAIGEHVVGELKKAGKKPLSTEGLKEGHWVLLDYGHVLIHIFYESVRGFYDLEGLWSDARRIQTNGMKAGIAEDAMAGPDDFDDEDDFESEFYDGE